MVARVKDKGLLEIRSFKARVLRQASLNRISKADADWMVEKSNEIEARIILMDEKPDRESEMF